MGVTSKTLTGARVKLYMENPATGQLQLAGIFGSVATGATMGLEPTYILGSYAAGELAYTSLDVITVTLTGFRVEGNGPYAIGNVPQLQDLLTNTDFHLSCVDRQTGDTILTVTGCRVQGWGGTHATRALSDLTVTVQGLVLSDESGPQEDHGATPYG